MDSLTWASVSLPRLTEGDKEALAAARGSRLGKIAGRTTAAFAGIVLLIGLAGLAGLRVDDQDIALSPIWLHWLLLIAVPVPAILVQPLAEWRAARTLLAVQELANRKAEIPRDYFRIGPYQDVTADRDDFDRPDGAHRLVLEWIQRAEAIPLYLSGASGTGKTSLLNAFVQPMLRAQGWTIVPIRASDDIEAALIDALPGGSWGQVVSVRERIEEAAREVDGPLLLVLDQFEEFLIQAPQGRRRAFAEVLADLAARPVANMKLLVVPRGDVIAELTASGLPGLVQGENTVRVEALPTEAARPLLMAPGVGLPNDVLDRLLAGAAALDETPGMVRLITLNVLGFIAKRQRRAGLAPGSAGRLVRHYIARAVDDPLIRGGSRKVLKGLITARATTRARSATELSSETSLCVAEVRAVLTVLTEAGLARPLSRDYWELAHDFVAEAIAAHLNTPRPLAWRRALRFAAPALLILSLPVAATLYRANLITADDAIAVLRGNGITIDTATGSVTASWTDHARLVNVDQSVPFLRRMRVRNLRLVSAPIDDVGALRGIAGLHGLDLSHTYTANIEPLRALTQLQSLGLAGTRTANLTALQNLRGLRSLDLAGTPATNIEPLRGLSVLGSLDLSRTAVTDLQPLGGLSALRSLDLSLTTVTNLQPLGRLSALRSLDLSQTAVTDIEALHGLTGLESLYLADTHVANLDPLRGMKALRSLDLTGTQMTALTQVAGLTGLRSLRLRHAPIKSLDPLRALTELRTLDVSASPIVSVEPLRGLRALRSLDLSETAVADLKPLRALPALSFLDLRSTRVSSKEIDLFVKARGAAGLPAVEVSQ